MRAFAVALSFSLMTCAAFAQTSQPVTSTVVYTKPGVLETLSAAHQDATFVKAGPSGLTFKKPDGHYLLVSAPGLVYKAGEQWLPSQLKVASASDGSGWVIQGTAINAAFSGKGADKDLVITSGSVAYSLHLPALHHNGDDTFTFEEGGTRWLLRVAETGVSIEAIVPKRLGKGATKHTFHYQASGAQAKLASNPAEGIDVGSEVRVNRAIVVGADKKQYYVCSAWEMDSNSMSFSCDDSKLPETAFPYVIDPTWTATARWYLGTNPLYYSRTGFGYGYFSWISLYSYDLPSNSQVVSETVNTSGLNISVQADPNMASSNCVYDGMFAWGGEVSIQFHLDPNYDYVPHGCIATIGGTETLSATVEYWVPTISAPWTPSGPASTFTGTATSYSTGGANTSSGQAAQYLFDWGDGTNSGWLSTGVTSVAKAWPSVGTYTVTAQARDSVYTDVTASSSGTTVSVSQSQLSQTISFGTLSSRAYGTAPFSVSATASSGLAVSFNSQTALICTVSGVNRDAAGSRLLHHPGDPGRQRQLHCCDTRESEFHGHPGEPNDHLRHDIESKLRCSTVHCQRHGDLRAGRQLQFTDDVDLHGIGFDRDTGWGRNMHHPGDASGQHQLRSGFARQSELHGHPGEPNHHLWGAVGSKLRYSAVRR